MSNNFPFGAWHLFLLACQITFLLVPGTFLFDTFLFDVRAIAGVLPGAMLSSAMSYSRRPVRIAFGGPPTFTVKWLIVACVVMFILEQVAPLSPLVSLLTLVPAKVLRGFLWQLATYLFLHAGVFHLVINMIWLYMFGGDVERYFGSRKFLAFFVGTGAAGGIAVTIASLFLAVPAVVVGASGSLFAIMVAWALLYPSREIFLFPFPIPIQARWFAALAIGVELLIVWSLGGNMLGSVAHLGGALAGFLYMKRPRSMIDPRSAYRRYRNRKIAKKFRVIMEDGFLDPDHRKDDGNSYLN